MQTDYHLYTQEYSSYENFKNRTSNLSNLNSTNYKSLISEFTNKMTQLDREYSNREQEVNQEISRRFNAMKTGQYDAINDFAAALHQNQARKQLNKEKQEAQNRLRVEKDKKEKLFIDRFKRDILIDKRNALRKAKHAISEQNEIYYIKLYNYFDCMYKNPYGVLYNQSNCQEPYSTSEKSNINYTAEDFYNAYNRKNKSFIPEIRKEANSFLEMAIRANPNKPKWLYEKAKISNNTLESLSLLNRALELDPQNSFYLAELQKVQKKRFGELGEIGDKVNGKKHGEWLEYWANGELKQIVNYVDGKKVGDYLLFYDKDWALTSDRNAYEYYRLVTYDERGKVSLEVKDFYKSGNLQMLGQYEDETHTIKTGEFQWYNENGSLSIVRNYKKGKLHGNELIYAESGIIKSNINYENGKAIDYLELRDEQGNPLKSEPFRNGLARLSLNTNNKMGFINEDGFIVVPVIYDWVDYFIEDIAIVKENNKFGGVHKNGEEVIPLKYDELKRLNDGNFIASIGNRKGKVDRFGNEDLNLQFETSNLFSSEINFGEKGLALVKEDEKFGFIDKEGNTVVDFIYDIAYPFNNSDITRVAIKDKLQYGSKTKYGYINTEGKLITPIIYDFIYPFKNGFGWVKKNGLMTFVNENGQEIIEPKYTQLLFKDSRKDKIGYSGYEFNEGLARVKKGNKFGFIDTNGNLIIDIIYNQASHFEGGEATVVHSAFGLTKIKHPNPLPNY